MSIDLALRWLTAAVLIAIAIWEIIQLSRRRTDLPLRVLVPGLIALSVAATIGIRTPLLVPVKMAFGSTWPILINGCWMMMAWAFAGYFALVDTARPRSSRIRTTLTELALLVIALCIVSVLVEAYPTETGHSGYRTWQHALFYLSVDGYALGIWVVGVRRATRYVEKVQNSWARAALWLVIVGSAAMALGVDAVSLLQQSVRAANPHAHLSVLHTIYSTGQLAGQVLLALGLALAPIASLMVGIKKSHERRLRATYTTKMEPVWQVLAAEFPHITLVGSDRSADSEERFEKVTAEITDGLSELSRDCPEPESDTRDPEFAATVIEDGLARRVERRQQRWSDDGPEDLGPPYPTIEPEFGYDWRARSRWMIGVSNALVKRGAIRKDTEKNGWIPAHSSIGS